MVPQFAGAETCTFGDTVAVIRRTWLARAYEAALREVETALRGWDALGARYMTGSNPRGGSLFGGHLTCCGPVRSGYAPQDRREYRLAGGERAVKDRAARAVSWWRAVEPDKRARPAPTHWTPERKRDTG
ncbi:hypothetical protein NDU88_001451 [Pleurodeles waltl]|uniref:Uncharacterized protein n=1 Tax=Pleurodeles waltl TaxID=8319 RepID=A0AAV7NAS4_PLEWA|nr:hypothetical protein NDU88_001451 [Pleurodeles waltl]